jgi:SAM-dependent methyltransferase
MTRTQKDIVREGYDRVSHVYHGDDTPDGYEQYAQWINDLIRHLQCGADVLDIGCGCGLPATRLLARHVNVTGVDFSTIQIQRARQLVPNARFICGDIMDQDFQAASFDAVVSFYAIIHMPLEDHAPLLRRISSWLRPAGYLLATVGRQAWTGTDEAYLGVEGGKMCWSHADEATYLQWIADVGLQVHWTRSILEGSSGHTLVFAQKDPIDSECDQGREA